MDSDFWLQRWQQQQIGFHQPEINPYLQKYFPQLALAAGAHVFVPLCGKTLDLLWLQQQGYRTSGIELSELAVKAFFLENKIKPTIAAQADLPCWQADDLRVFCGDFFQLRTQTLGPVDAVFDRAALIALPADMRPAYVQHMQTLLGPQTKQIIVTLCYDQARMPGPPFSVASEEVETLYRHAYNIELLASHEVLEANPQFRSKGLGRLTESVYLLNPF